jgi:hypothetical protein
MCLLLRCFVAFALVGLSRLPAAEPVPVSKFVFKDVGRQRGLFPALEGIHGHGAGWGDADGDGFVDLYVATFQKNGKPNQLLLQRDGQFVVDDQPVLKAPMRGNTPLFVDLDNDGDLDLYVASMPNPKENSVGCQLYRNDGGGKFVDISTQSGACPEAFGGRSLSAFDYDGDGLLDLIVGEEPLVGYNGSTTKSSRLFHNDGQLKFTDVSRAAGLPADVPGLGTAAGDFNDDGLPDFFLSAHAGGSRMFLNLGGGKFREATELSELFFWPNAKGDNMVTGVSAGDVNLDGRLDLIVGPHFDSPWKSSVGPRLFLNTGISAGDLKFEEVTDAVGIAPLALKCPHVEIQDFDNDGLPDISVSVVKFAGGNVYPIIYRNTGIKDGRPQFVVDGWNVNDFPTDADRATKGTGGFFKKMIADGKVTYTAPGPTADFDNDGRLDMFLASWWPEQRSLLLRNETSAGHWLQVQVVGKDSMNRMGIGAKVRLYPSGKLGDPASLIGHREIAIGFGYVSGQPAIAHFGLGEGAAVDVEVILPHGRGKLERRDVTADQRITIE